VSIDDKFRPTDHFSGPGGTMGQMWVCVFMCLCEFDLKDF